MKEDQIGTTVQGLMIHRFLILRIQKKHAEIVEREAEIMTKNGLHIQENKYQNININYIYIIISLSNQNIIVNSWII